MLILILIEAPDGMYGVANIVISVSNKIVYITVARGIYTMCISSYCHLVTIMSITLSNQIHIKEAIIFHILFALY